MINLQHCDEVIALQYPNMADKTNWTFIGALIIIDDDVALIETERRVHLDRSMVSRQHVSCSSCHYQ